MKKNISVTFLFVLSLSAMAFSQNKTYFGMEAAITFDVNEIADNGNNLKNVPLMSGLWGFNLRKELSPNFFLETGIIDKHYAEGFGFNSVNNFSSLSSGNESLIIPFRLGSSINLSKERIFLTPVIGYSICFNSHHGAGGFAMGSIKSGNDSVSYNYTINEGFTESFSLLQTGIGIEFKILKKLLFSVSGNYYTGFQKRAQLDINYVTNNQPESSGKAYSKGQFLSIGAALKYPISNFWMKKEQAK